MGYNITNGGRSGRRYATTQKGLYAMTVAMNARFDGGDMRGQLRLLRLDHLLLLRLVLLRVRRGQYCQRNFRCFSTRRETFIILI